MVLSAVYTLVMMITVIPAGVFADKIGRKKVLVINSIFFFTGWIAFYFSDSFFQFMICEILIALSSSTWSAAGTAFFYDSVKEIGKEKQFNKLYGRVVTINYLMWGFSSLVGGYIVSSDFRNIFLFTGVSCFIAFLVTLSFKEPRLYSKQKDYISHLKSSTLFVIKNIKVRIFIICSSVVFAIFLMGLILYQPYLVSTKLPLVYFGIAYLIMEFSAAFGSNISHKIEKYLGEKKILVLLLGLMIISFFGMSKISALIGIVFPIMMYFASGVFEPVITDYINKMVMSYHRATVMAINSLITEFIATIMGPIFGFIVDAWSLSTALLLIGVVLVVDLFILMIFFYRIKN
jgi:MFS family permease